jgi:hypothetical protein
LGFEVLGSSGIGFQAVGLGGCTETRSTRDGRVISMVREKYEPDRAQSPITSLVPGVSTPGKAKRTFVGELAPAAVFLLDDDGRDFVVRGAIFRSPPSLLLNEEP